jgi:hypothetical protein
MVYEHIHGIGIGPLLILFIAALIVIPFWQLCTKAGYSGWLSFLMLVPLVNVLAPRVFGLACITQQALSTFTARGGDERRFRCAVETRHELQQSCKPGRPAVTPLRRARRLRKCATWINRAARQADGQRRQGKGRLGSRTIQEIHPLGPDRPGYRQSQLVAARSA